MVKTTLPTKAFIFVPPGQKAAVATEETWISHPPPSPRAGTTYPVQEIPHSDNSVFFLVFAFRAFFVLITSRNRQAHEILEESHSHTHCLRLPTGPSPSHHLHHPHRIHGLHPLHRAHMHPLQSIHPLHIVHYLHNLHNLQSLQQ